MAQQYSFHKALQNWGAPKKSFNKKLSNGTSIFGVSGGDKRPGSKHGHSGSNFYRSPHSTIGSAAIGRSHTYSGHKTHRW